jgi:5-methylthioadenosine/S-adenosylhomocysteine deaminase
MSPQFVYDGTRLACAEMLRAASPASTTCISTRSRGRRCRLRIRHARHARHHRLEFPTPYASDADDYLNKGLAVRENWLNHPLIGFCLAPHAPYTVSRRHTSSAS